MSAEATAAYIMTAQREIAALQTALKVMTEERDSWRRVAERLEGEKQDALKGDWRGPASCGHDVGSPNG